MLTPRIRAALRRTELRWLLLLLAAAAAVKAPALGLWFHSPDDWISLDTGQRLAHGDLAALGRLFVEDTGRRSGRPVPYLLWGLDWALFRTWAPGYYATNLLLNLLGGAGVFWLAWRGTRSSLSAAVAGSWFLFNGTTNQGNAFLSARDDDLVAGFFLLAVLLWPWARDSLRGRLVVGAICLLAVFSKATGLALPLALVGFDVLELGPRRALSPHRALRVYWPPALAALAFVPTLIGLVEGNRRMLGAGAHGGVARALWVTLSSTLAPFLASYRYPPPMIADALRLAAVLGAIALALRGRRSDGRLALLGAGWLALNLIVPFPFLISGQNVPLEEGRYLLLPSVGVALLLAAGVGRAPRGLGRGLAATAVLLSVATYGLFQTPRFLDDRTGGPSFRAAARAVAADLPPDGRLWIAAKRVDQGLVGLISSSVFPEFVPELRGRPLIFREGATAAFLPRPPGPHGGASLVPAGRPLDLDAMDPERDALLVDVFTRAAPYDAPTAAWGRVALPLPPHRPAPPLEVRFDGSSGWTYGQLALLPDELAPTPWIPQARPGPSGLRLESRFPLMFHELTGALAQPPFFLPALLQSPPVDLPTAGYCSVEVDLRVMSRRHDPRPQPLTGPLLPASCFAALLWTSEDTFTDPFDRFVLLPSCTDRAGETVTARLDESPTWRTTGAVHRLALLPSSAPGEVELRALRLLPCGPDERSPTP